MSAVVVRGEGSAVFDPAGRPYLDFTSGTGVTNTGHAHPRVVAAVKDQASRLLHAQLPGLGHEAALRLREALRAVLPEPLGSILFLTTGSEAVEESIKLARRLTGRANVIVFEGGYHGRTMGTMSLSASEPEHAIGCHPLMAGVHVAPYPYAYRHGWPADATLAWCRREIEYLFMTRTSPEDTAAILVEPVLGEGGAVVPPQGFLPALREICDRDRILLILDEVMTGFGRTGRLLAFEHSRTRPDVVVMGKAIASGLPLSALAIRDDLGTRWSRRSPTSTFEANPLSCAAALATLDVIREEGLVENARRAGERLLEALRTLQRRHAVIGDVRGLGLLVGVECRAVPGIGSAGALSRRLVERCRDRGLLLRTGGPEERVVGWMPPLVVRPGEIDQALEIFGEALAQISSVPGDDEDGAPRKDERIREAVREFMTRNSHLDATDIDVSVSHGEATLTGTVTSRPAKRLAEDIAESIAGVTDVHNRLRVAPPGTPRDATPTRP